MLHKQTADRGSPVVLSSVDGERMRALRKIEETVIEGLRHGFFECTIACEVIKGEKRRLVIKAGVSHQFIIPQEEINVLN